METVTEVKKTITREVSVEFPLWGWALLLLAIGPLRAIGDGLYQALKSVVVR